MPNNQEIVLSLIAKLDQGNIANEAHAMAGSITAAVESAFESLGQRLAQILLKSMKTGLNEGMQDISQSIRNPSGQGVWSDPTTFVPTVRGQQPQVPGVAPPMAPLIPVINPQTQDPLSQFQGGTQPGFGPQTQAMQGLNIGRIQQGLAPAQVQDFQGTVSEARSILAARKAGIEIDVPEEQKERFKSEQAQAKEAMVGFVESITKLNAEIVKLNEQIKTSHPAKVEELENKKATLIQQREDTRRATTQMSEDVREVGKVINPVTPGPQGLMARAAPYAAAAAGVGAIAGLAGDIPSALRGREVATGQMENVEARAAMSGDIERLTALGRLGGVEQAQAGFGEGIARTGTSALRGATAGAVAGGMIGSVVPGLGTAIGGVVGGAVGGGLAGVKDLINWGRGQAGIMEEKIAAEQAASPEFYEMQRQGRGLALGGFQAARSLGSPEMAGLAAGGSAEMRMGAAGFGIGSQEQSQIMQRSMRSMGGNFFGQTPELMNNEEGLGQMSRLQGLGFGQAPEMAGALVQGGMTDRGAAMGTTKELFEDAVAAGLDKARVGQALMTTAGRIEQLGAGGAAAGISEMKFSTAAAQMYSGGGNIEGSTQQFMQQGAARIGDATRGSSGLGMIAGYQAAGKLGTSLNKMMKSEGKGAVQLDDLDLWAIQSKVESPKGVKDYLQREKGVTISDDQSERLFSGLISDRIKALGDVISKAAGGGKMGEKAARMMTGEMAGARTLEQVGMGANLYEAGKAGVTEALPQMDDAEAKEFLKTGRRPDIGKKLDATVTGTSAGQLAVTGAQAEASGANAGLKDLDGQAKRLAAGFDALLERTQKLFGGTAAAPVKTTFQDLFQTSSGRRGSVSPTGTSR